MAASIDTSNKSLTYFCLFLFPIIILICLTSVTLSEGQQVPSQERKVDVADVFDDDKLNVFAEKDESSDPRETTENTQSQNFHTFAIDDNVGNKILLSKYQGKVILVVNVASECGYTDGHYKGLTRLKNVLAPTDKFEILAFPCNQFGAQEPKSDTEIQQFVKDVYRVKFPVFAKINVLEENVPDAWQFLIASSGQAPTWNFWKYLVDETGHVINVWGPHIPVEDIFHEVKEAIDKIGYQKPRYTPPRPGDEL